MAKNGLLFVGKRSEMYKKGHILYPHARAEDIEAMKTYLNPQNHEYIIEVGAGSGFFSKYIASMCNHLIITDPSSEQLEGIQKASNISITGK